MQGNRSAKRSVGGKDISNILGFYYSPVNTQSRSSRRPARQQCVHRLTTDFAQAKYLFFLICDCIVIEWF